MREIGPDLRQGYITALAGLQHNGQNVEVYDELAPADPGRYYIILLNQYDGDASTKDTFCNETHITLDIVTKVDLESNDGSHRDAIADQVLQRVVKLNEHLGMGVNFRIITTKKTLSKNLTVQVKDGRLFRKIITIKHIIQEL